MKTGIEQVSQERIEQVEKHGYTVDKDVANNSNSQLIDAIMMLVANIGFKRQGFTIPNEAFEDLKPEDWRNSVCRKMLDKTEIEHLKLIGAFAAAEIDRLQALA